MDYVIHSGDVTKNHNGRPVRMYDIGADASWKIWTGSKFELSAGPLVYVMLYKVIQPCMEQGAIYVRVEGGKYDGYKGLFICMT